MQQTNIITSPYIKRSIWVITAAVILIGAALFNQRASVAADAVVYKSATCGCCNGWIKHMQQNGFTTEAHNSTNLQQVKNKMGVPSRLASCHTAMIGGYIIEGHVPADVIARLLKEKPAIKGLAVPGMPMGSPGMEGPRKDPYNVVAFDEKGNTSVYARK
jgi:hypothetical protein